MSNILDRGAAAVWKEVVGDNCHPYEEGSRAVRAYMQKAFRAAVAQIREPTERMIAAGIVGSVVRGGLIPTPSRSIAGAYAAMIEALLAELDERLESAPDA